MGIWNDQRKHLGGEAPNLFKDFPGEGMLFPYRSRVRAGGRATDFASTRPPGEVRAGDFGT